MKEICAVCKEEIEPKQLVKHHISYFPEKKVFVHRKCHPIIHRSKDKRYLKLKPKEGEAAKFYGGYRILIDLDDKIIKVVEELAKAEKRSRKQMLELIIEEGVNPKKA